MKNYFKFSSISFALFSLVTLTGCAAGAATAAYSVKANTADNLTSEAEQRIVERTKRELRAEFNQTQCTGCNN